MAALFGVVNQSSMAQGVVAASGTQPVVDTRAAEAALARPVSVHMSGVALRRVIDAIAKAANAKIVYRIDLVEKYSTPVSINVVRVPLGEALSQLLARTALKPVAMAGGHIGITEASMTGRGVADGIISGTVTNAKTKQPMRGVSVVLEDNGKVIRTNDAGIYRFVNVSAGSHRITVRFVGYARQTVVVTVSDDQTVSANFWLESNTVNTLDQVVVTATGEQRVRELGHVVARVNADSLVKAAPIGNVSDLLQARIPGLQVYNSDGGMAGGEVSLRLRGTTTFSLDPEPIVIVDGVRYQSNNLTSSGSATMQEDFRSQNGELQSPLNNLNPNDIATIEVVKGPSASTLYGPDASNGVIVITTKRGTPGKTKFSWYARPVSNEVPRSRIDQGYKIWSHDPATNALYTGGPCYLILQYEYNQCVVDSITAAPTSIDDGRYSVLAKSRPTWQYGANLSGGTSQLQYFFSGNYNAQVGVVQIAPAVQDYLKQQLGVHALSDAIRNPNTLRVLSGRANITSSPSPKGQISLLASYTQMDHRMVVTDVFMSQLRKGAPQPGVDTTDIGSFFGNNNPGITPSFSLKTTDELGGLWHIALDGSANPFPWWFVGATVGLNLNGTITRSILPRNTVDDVDNEGFAQDDRRTNTVRTVSLRTTGTARLGTVLSFRTSLGLEYLYSHLDGLSVIGGGLAPGSASIGTVESKSVYQVWTESISLGPYAEEVIGVNDRLFLTSSLRYDGSTSFGDAYHPVPNPKVGISWIASDEPFLRGTPGLNTLRFRASYGKAGRNPTSMMKLGFQNGSGTIVEGETQTIYQRSLLANPHLKPERTQEFEYGVDANVVSNIELGLAWNHRRTNDQLLQIQNAGGLYPQWANVGDMSGHGFEATATIPLFDARHTRADVLFTYSAHRDKVLRLESITEQRNAYGNGYAVGYPIGAVFGQRIIGVADTVGNHADGIAFFEEVVRDTVNRYLGVSYPPHTLTITPMVSLWNGMVRVSSLFDRQTGFLLWDAYSFDCEGNALCLGPFVPTTSLLAQAKYQAGFREDFLVPGDFTAWREFNISVNVPSRFLRIDPLHLRFSSATLGLQGRNLALWTKYTGPDPQSRVFGGYPTSANGIPQARIWSVRFDVTP